MTIKTSKRLLYFSDNAEYLGSERNIVNIMNYIAEQTEHQLFFAFRYSKDYQRGVNNDLSEKVKKLPLKLLSNYTLFIRINRKFRNRVLKLFVKLPLWLFQKSGIFTIVNYYLLRKIIFKIKPDLIHINNGGYPASFICQTAVFVAHNSKINSIVYHVNNYASKQKGLLDHLIDKKIGQYVSCFITGSKQSKKSLEINRFFNPHKIEQIYNTISVPKILKSREQILNEYHIDNKKFILSVVAFLSEQKGQRHVLNAFKIIKEKYPDIFKELFLFLIGDGEDYNLLISYCKKNDLDNVLLTGYLPNYSDFINASDIFLLPSIAKEDMPLVILTAMSLSKPIISTQIAGIVEEIENEISGKLIKIEEICDLYKEIVNLYINPYLRQFYSKNAYRQFVEKFSQQKIYAKIINIYDALLSIKED